MSQKKRRHLSDRHEKARAVRAFQKSIGFYFVASRTLRMPSISLWEIFPSVPQT